MTNYLLTLYWKSISAGFSNNLFCLNSFLIILRKYCLSVNCKLLPYLNRSLYNNKAFRDVLLICIPLFLYILKKNKKRKQIKIIRLHLIKLHNQEFYIIFKYLLFNNSDELFSLLSPSIIYYSFIEDYRTFSYKILAVSTVFSLKYVLIIIIYKFI